jgi:hypothetical protein
MTDKGKAKNRDGERPLDSGMTQRSSHREICPGTGVCGEGLVDLLALSRANAIVGGRVFARRLGKGASE